MKLTLEELEPLVHDVFSVWTSRGDRRWCAQMWEVIERAGLTLYEDDLEYHLALFRFLALAGIYKDYCLIRYDERDGELLYADWLSWYLPNDHPLQPDWFIVGQMIAADAAKQNLRSFASFERKDALNLLVDRQREAVFHTLVEGLGWELDFFESLYRSTLSPENELDEDEREQGRRMVEDAQNSPDWDDVDVWEWIQEGCPRRHFTLDR